MRRLLSHVTIDADVRLVVELSGLTRRLDEYNCMNQRGFGLETNAMDKTERANSDSAETRPHAKRRRRWFVVAAVFSSFTLSLIAAEIALRIYVAARGWTPNCYAAHLSLFRPHPDLGCELTPNFRLKSGTFNMSTNSRGLRGPERPEIKPEGTIRIAILGGSSVFGYLVNDGEEAARILEEDLRRQGHAVEVINAAVPGYNLFRSRVRFQQIVAELEPDIVVLYAGYNDIPYVTSEDPAPEHWLRQPAPAAWERWLGHSVTYGVLAYRLVNRSPNFMNIVSTGDTMTISGQKQFRSNLDAIAREVEEVGARLVVCSQATAAHPNIAQDLQTKLGTTDDEIQIASDMMDWIRQELRQFAATSKADFIDVSSEIPPTLEYLGDLIHLTKSGERELGRVLTRHLLQNHFMGQTMWERTQ